MRSPVSVGSRGMLTSKYWPRFCRGPGDVLCVEGVLPFCEYVFFSPYLWRRHVFGFYAGTVIGNSQTTAPTSPLPKLNRNCSFSSLSSLGASVCSQSSFSRKLVSTFSRSTSSPAKIRMDEGEGNTSPDDLKDSFEEICESRQLVFGRSYRSSSPECTYVFRTGIFWRRYSREKLRQSDPAQRSVSSGIFLSATHSISYPFPSAPITSWPTTPRIHRHDVAIEIVVKYIKFGHSSLLRLRFTQSRHLSLGRDVQVNRIDLLQ